MNQATVDRALRALAEMNAPQMPDGVQLLSWELRPPPVILSRFTVVNDVADYVRTTLDELDVALHQQHDTIESVRRNSTRSNGAINVLVQLGAMAVRECIDRLEQCGVIVRVPGIGSGGGKQ